MAKVKRIEKVYKTNVDTVSLNVERFSSDLGLFPYGKKWGGEENHWWLPSTDSRRLRKKGSRVS